MEYLIVDASCAGVIGIDNTNAILQYYLASPNYLLDKKFSNNMFFLFKVIR